MVQFVRKLNKSYRRIYFVIGGVFKILDGVIDIISYGYVRLDLNMWWTRRIMRKFLSCLENECGVND
uniref:Uncharacterized protein n=1 Tax=viral metagenome TaxID=1070528 RepID=A0A6M3X589_9ZZZZ